MKLFFRQLLVLPEILYIGVEILELLMIQHLLEPTKTLDQQIVSDIWDLKSLKVPHEDYTAGRASNRCFEYSENHVSVDLRDLALSWFLIKFLII